jgi:hypothetical protein
MGESGRFRPSFKTRLHRLLFAFCRILSMPLLWIIPVVRIASMAREFRRYDTILRGDPSQAGDGVPRAQLEFHRPSRLHVMAFLFSQNHLLVERVCATWVVPQFALAFFLYHQPTFRFPVWFPKSALIVSTVALDVGIWSLLLALLVASVAVHGPTSVAYVRVLKCDNRLGDLSRRVEQIFPSEGDAEVQACQWNWTRILIEQIARVQVLRRLLAIFITAALMILTASCISVLFATGTLKSPLLAYSGGPLLPRSSPLQHMYFGIVTLATIGYGDVSFVNNSWGHLCGVLSSLCVLLFGGALVSYFASFVVTYRERLLSGFCVLASASRKTPSWLWQSLRRV